MNLFVFLLLLVGLVSIIVSWLRSDLKCPPPKIIYRIVPKHTLDVQFGEENKPSEIYKDLFTKNNPWIGGMDLGTGKAYSISQNTVKSTSVPENTIVIQTPIPMTTPSPI